ncbi:MAG TPA: excinuclease ABC subunit UvrA [Candidatus Moranbacteria bacterium]|nr:excinuclease ABC subunit UvrA [Candidatus Moranbacteria bacterium]HBI50286.1 excinuclease ABC subunit UvrA [Candidatus Moranbacteria bacterium]HBU10989.1 excinuclease ABC subunit UvrA [Candidatus Moranbacteria bacterium]HCO99074.1 excinuclease ABC subunit UvrA [Candidatus Moranbacteria bacterium]
MEDKIIIKGAREHNLKNIDLELPRNKFIVFTGLSGSGKSTLAFDTIFAEGQRRYLESLSSYARQFLGQMDKPDVDYIQGLSPAISIDQKSTSHNPRSTVGTVTEIHDYLRLLFAKVGIPHCSICGREISKLSTDEIVDRILDMGGKSKSQIIEISSPIVRERKGEYLSMLDDMWKRGYSEAIVDGKLERLENFKDIKLGRYNKHSIDIIVDNIAVNEENLSRIFEGVEKALRLSHGIVKVKCIGQKLGIRNEELGLKSKISKNKKVDDICAVEQIFNQNLSCPIHDIEFPEMEPRLFSFNSPYGACEGCEGLGMKKEIDPARVMPDLNKTIGEGAIMPWSFKPNNYQGTVLKAVAQYYSIPDNKRLRDLSKDKIDILLYGTEDEDLIKVKYHFKSGSGHYNVRWKGVVAWLQERYRTTTSDAVRTDIEKYMSQKPCSTCKGTRYKSDVLLVSVGGKNIYEISALSIWQCIEFFKNLKITTREELIAGRILKEIVARLVFLNNVGLDYLTLGRAAYSLSGGESQRIRLASQIGSQLVGVLYILDEPSIGLHARDNAKLIETLRQLQQIGNTLIVIEHDEEMMRSADWLVDIGPGAGKHGGEIVAQGLPQDVINNPKSLTGKYLRHELEIEIPKFRRQMKRKRSITVRGASEHNLKNVTVEFPLKVFTCVTGVSGSGKSTLVEETLYKALANKLHRALDVPAKHNEIIGIENINKVIMIDQSPIGRTPRSNPATYTGLFTHIRELFAQTKDAKLRGYGPGRFSFNVAGGRCDNCSGEGYLKIEMQFMPDVYLPCDVCSGKRYNSETLQVKYKGKNISEVLAMTVSEGVEFFGALSKIYEPLKVLEEVGLGYIELGQSATTLSGGEAQRIKLASELSRRATGDTLYILDEPTTGLHFDDIKKLLTVLNRLVDAGNTVVVIEHNMDVIKTADWIIDMGPEGGDGGGKIVVTGPPEEVIKYYKESYTAKYLRQVLKPKSIT